MQWLNICAHSSRIGLRSQRHDALRTCGDRRRMALDHMLALRGLQDEARNRFIPLAFHSRKHSLSHLPPPTGYQILKVIRDFRDCCSIISITSRRTGWMLTPSNRANRFCVSAAGRPSTAQVVEEKIYHERELERPSSPRASSSSDLIREAGPLPVERDTLYRPV